MFKTFDEAYTHLITTDAKCDAVYDTLQEDLEAFSKHRLTFIGKGNWDQKLYSEMVAEKWKQFPMAQFEEWKELAEVMHIDKKKRPRKMNPQSLKNLKRGTSTNH